MPGRASRARAVTASGLLLVVDDLGVDDVVGLAVARRRTGALATRRAGARVAVERLARLLLRLHQGVERPLDGRRVVRLERLLHVVDRPFDGEPIGRIELVARVLEELLCRVDGPVGAVAGLDLL